MERIRGLLVLSALIAAASLLWWLRGAVGTPAVESWGAAEQWYDTVGPASAVVACARVVALGTAVCLALAAALEVLASTHPWTGAGALADVVAPRSLQRMVHGLAGLSLTAGVALPAPSAGILAIDGPAVPLAALVDPAEREGTATMHLVAQPGVDQPGVDQPVVDQPAVEAVTQVTVLPGDSFWSIAEDALRTASAPAPGDAEVARYWRRVIEENRAALVDPATPDLIYSGQVFTLPSR